MAAPKKLYCQIDIDTVSQIPHIVHRSSNTNLPQLYEWQWREWDTWLNQYFTPIKGIRNIQHLCITAEEEGKVFFKPACDSVEEKEISILKREITVADIQSAGLPQVLKPEGLTRERQQYLYSNIREPPYQDITCPKPD